MLYKLIFKTILIARFNSPPEQDKVKIISLEKEPEIFWNIIPLKIYVKPESRITLKK